MKNKKIITTFVVIIINIITITIIKMNLKNKETKNNENIINDIYTEIDKNQISYNKNARVDDLKNDTGITGDSNIYDVQSEYDGRKVLNVKSEIKYKVAFSGMIEKKIVSLNEINNIYEKNMPHNNGIWIEKTSKEKILDYLNSTEELNSKYEIDNAGYLKIGEKNSQNEKDEKIEKLINDDKQYIFDISSICYIVDEVTGEILDYSFENMDKYQIYEYFEDDNKKIVFITENKDNQLSKKDIFNSVLDML